MKESWLGGVALGVSALAASGAALAADGAAKNTGGGAPLEEMYITGTPTRFGATKSDIPILETARSVSIETNAAYIERGALELDDVLGYTAGVSAEAFGFSLRGDFPKVRGLEVPEYRDGLQSHFGFYNNTRPHIYTLEQVEVLKGPASVLFGRGTAGGIVNVVSKRPRADFAADAFASVGNFDRYEAGGDITGPLLGNGKVLGRLVAVVRDSGTQIDEVNNDTFTVAPSLTFRPTSRTNITLLGRYTDTDSDTAHQFLPLFGTLRDHPSGRTIDSYAYLGQPDWNRYDTQSEALSLIADHRFNDTVTFEVTARYRDSESQYNQTWIAFMGDGVPRTDAAGNGTRTWYISDGYSEAVGADARTRWNFGTGPLTHEVLAGVHYQDVEYGADRSYIPAFGTINVFDPVYGEMPSEADFEAAAYSVENTSEMLGLYINDQITFRNWLLTAGVRFDDVKTDGQNDNAESFSVGLMYRSDFGLSPYASYAESFEPVVGTDNVTNDPLKPRQGEQYELGVKYQYSPRMFATAAYFDIERSNLPNPGGLIGEAPSQQEGVSKIQGFEFEGVAGAGPVNLEVSFSVLDTEDPNGFPLSSVPETKAAAWLSYRPQTGRLEGFKAGLGVRYSGDITSQSSAIKVETPSYAVFDAMIGYETGKWALTINARNLADKDYYTTCLARGDCYPGERRTVVGRLSRSF